eukprot:4536343-Lingulodinium_polyedra.AAC.1
MLRTPEEAAALREEIGLERAFSDRSLAGRPRVYADFLARLHSCCVVKYARAQRWRLLRAQEGGAAADR